MRGAARGAIAAGWLLLIPAGAAWAQEEAQPETAPGTPAGQTPAAPEAAPAPGEAPDTAEAAPAPDAAAEAAPEQGEAAAEQAAPGAQPQPRAGIVPGPHARQAPAGEAAWRSLLAGNVDVAQRAEQAAARLAEAELYLVQTDAESAIEQLQSAAAALQTLLDEAPGSSLTSQLGAAAAQLQLQDEPEIGLDQLVTQVLQMRAVLPADVPALLEDARRQFARGNADAATRALLDARRSLLEDFSLLPAEQAFARTRAALAEAEAGNLGLARDLVQGVPDSIAELRGTAPLVPARLYLRAAAAEAGAGEWAAAESLLNEAGSALDQIQAAGSSSLSSRITSLRWRVGSLREQIASGQYPPARRIRQVAETAGRPAG